MRLIVLVMLIAVALASCSRTRTGTSPNLSVYGEYPGRQQYSSLDQINPRNVQRLHVAWVYDIGERGKTFEATPIVVNNVMYFPTPDSKVVALDATTGRKIWEYDPDVKYARVSRGLAYWPGGPNASARIIFGTADGRVVALDPKTGRVIPGFGKNGQVDVRDAALSGYPHAPFWYTSPPALIDNMVIMSPALQEGPARGATGDGDPRAFNALTGQQSWQFHTMPLAGEFGADTWNGPKGILNRSGPSAWVPIAVDRKRGLIFVTTGNPADSYYGGDRDSSKGTNLYSNCVVALDAKTGQMRWYFQMVHHDTWDFDGVDSAVIEIHQNGATIPAVAALDKSGLLFILNELTGKPVFGVKERPVPKSDVPGDPSYATQPFPVMPPPLSRDSFSAADLTNVTPQSAKYCRELWSQYHNDGPFTPFGLKPTVNFPSTIGGPNWDSLSFSPKLGYIFVSTSELGGRGQMAKPGSAAARAVRFRREGRPRGRGFFGTTNFPMPYRNVMAATRFADADGYPCQKPPWGLLTAVNSSTGEVVWKVPLGNYGNIEENGMAAASLTQLPEGPGMRQVQKFCATCHGIATVLQQRMSRQGWTNDVNDMIGRGMRVNAAQKTDIINYLATHLGNTAGPSNPALPGPVSASGSVRKSKRTGTPNLGGSLATGGDLVFIGATLDNKFRAFDARTGKVLWSYQLDGVGMATPMSFLGSDGKQYVVIATGGPGLLRSVHNEAGESPDKIVVFTLNK